MSCEMTHSVLHGYLDGELDAARAAEFERHLLSCPQCVAALEAQETLRSSIHRAGLHERAPETCGAGSTAEFGGSRRLCLPRAWSRKSPGIPARWLAVRRDDFAGCRAWLEINSRRLPGLD